MITVYSQPNCAWCVAAKTLLSVKGIPYTEVMLGTDMPKVDFLAKYPGVRTLPLITSTIPGHPEQVLGGYKQLIEYLE